jgi:hypothetical protein
MIVIDFTKNNADEGQIFVGYILSSFNSCLIFDYLVESRYAWW